MFRVLRGRHPQGRRDVELSVCDLWISLLRPVVAHRRVRPLACALAVCSSCDGGQEPHGGIRLGIHGHHTCAHPHAALPLHRCLVVTASHGFPQGCVAHNVVHGPHGVVYAQEVVLEDVKGISEF